MVPKNICAKYKESAKLSRKAVRMGDASLGLAEKHLFPDSTTQSLGIAEAVGVVPRVLSAG